MRFEIAPTQSAELLAGLHALTFETAWDEAEFARLLALPGIVAFVALAPEPAGFVLAWKVGDDGEILAMGTLPEHRRRGAGRALLDAAAAALGALGASAMLLEVREDNGAARALYERAGFVFHATRKGYYKTAEGPRDALLLRRALR